MIRAALLALFVAFPIAARALPSGASDDGSIPGDAPPRAERPRGLGLSLEGLLAGFWEDDPQGSPFVRKTGWGLRLGWDLSRQTGLQETRWSVQPELQWTTRSDSEGTRAVVVENRLDSFYLGARIGYRLGSLSSPFRVVPYAAAGPSATWTRVRYKVADPVGTAHGSKPTEHELGSLQWGVGYGLGVGASFHSDDGTGLTGRLELLRFHRSYLEELALTLGLGVAF